MEQDDISARAEKELKAELDRPFGLADDLKVRCVALRFGAEQWHLTFIVDHLVADWASVGVLLEDFSRCYARFIEGGEAALPPTQDYREIARLPGDRGRGAFARGDRWV